jgi:hypothetical protein
MVATGADGTWQTQYVPEEEFVRPAAWIITPLNGTRLHTITYDLNVSLVGASFPITIYTSLLHNDVSLPQSKQRFPRDAGFRFTITNTVTVLAGSNDIFYLGCYVSQGSIRLHNMTVTIVGHPTNG